MRLARMVRQYALGQLVERAIETNSLFRRGRRNRSDKLLRLTTRQRRTHGLVAQ
jgi:hypothetical protein